VRCASAPAPDSVVVVSPGVYYSVSLVFIRRIIADLAVVKSVLNYLHAGIGAILQQIAHFVRQETQILRNNAGVRHGTLDDVYKLLAGSQLPITIFRSLIPGRNRKIAFQAAKMIQPQHIEKVKAFTQPLSPPLITCFRHSVPAI
jgi:hypothetical protein